jgi:hypothetical protein
MFRNPALVLAVFALRADLSISAWLWRGVSGRFRNLARNIQRWMRRCKEVARASCRLRRIVLVWCFREDNQQHVRVVLPRASTLEGHHPERSWNQRPPVRI